MSVFTQGTGTAYPSQRSSAASRKEQTALDAGTAFNTIDTLRAINPDADSGPPYAVKGAALRTKVAVSPTFVERRVAAARATPARLQQFATKMRGRAENAYENSRSAFGAANDYMVQGRHNPESILPGHQEQENFFAGHAWRERELGHKFQAAHDTANVRLGLPVAPFDIAAHNAASDTRGRLAPEFRTLVGSKVAGHPHDRIEERTPLHKGNIEPLQRAVDFLGLSPGSYHLPLRGKDGQVLGYAQFKGVPNRKGPVLATVLAPHMTPGGVNLETFTKKAELATSGTPRQSGLFDTDDRAPLPPEALGWNGTHQTVGRQESTGYAMRRAFEDVNHAVPEGAME